MSLGAPLGLLAAALAVPLIAWYVLRSRRPRVTVASTFLWQDVDRSVAAAVPWQRFRPDLTFWLVALALLAGALALARPFVPVATELGDHTVLVVDVSGSMLADEDGPSRLELARREATALVDRLGPGQRVSVVEAGARARVVLSGSTDAGAATDALGSLRPDHGAADLLDAFTLASALERPGEQNVAILFTDAEVPSAAVGSAPRGLSVVPVGTDRPNLAVTRLQAVPDPGGSSQVFVQVRNFGQVGADAELELAVGDEVVVQERFRLAPRGTEDRVLAVDGVVGEVLSATVAPVGEDLVTGAATTDALTLDDRAVALLSGTRELAVTLATPGNVFLASALEAVPGVEVTVVDAVPAGLVDRTTAGSGTDGDGTDGGTPDGDVDATDTETDGTEAGDVDLLVVDRLPVPGGLVVPTLLVAPTSAPPGLTLGAEVTEPALTFQSPGDDLLAEVDLSDTAVASATPLAGPTLGAVAGGPSGDLVVAGRLDGVPVVAIGFDLLQSNLPLQPAWPVFVNNVVTGLAGPGSALPVLAGQTVTLPVPAGATAVSVDPPGDEARTLDLASPRLTVDEVGLWRLAWEGDGVDGAIPAVAVNADPAESDLLARRPDPGPLAAEDAAAAPTTTTEGRRSIVPWVLAAVLALVVLEWLWSQLVRPARADRARRGGPGGGGRRWAWRRRPDPAPSSPTAAAPAATTGHVAPDPADGPADDREEVGV